MIRTKSSDASKFLEYAYKRLDEGREKPLILVFDGYDLYLDYAIKCPLPMLEKIYGDICEIRN